MRHLVCILIAFAAASCSHSTNSDEGYDLLASPASTLEIRGLVDPGNPRHAEQRGSGWHAPERGRTGLRKAWTSQPRAVVTLESDRTSAARLHLRGYGLDDGSGPRTLGVEINGVSLGTQTLPTETSTISFDVPDRTLELGANQITLVVDRCPRVGSRNLGMLVDFVCILPPDVEPPQRDPSEDRESMVLDAQRRFVSRVSDLSSTRLDLSWATKADGTVRLEVVSTAGDVLESLDIDAREQKTSLELGPNLPLSSTLTVEWIPASTDPRSSVELTAASLSSAGRKDNVVLFVVDTLRADYLGCYGRDDVDTPNIDQLAADGVLFEWAFCSSPITAPSHAALFTSHHPSETGITNNHRTKLPETIPQLSELLQVHGYDSAGVVSISPIEGRLGFGRGWRKYDDRMGLSWIVPSNIIRERAVELVPTLREPFLFWTHTSDPHEPYDAHGMVEHTAHVFLDDERLATVTTSTYETIELALTLPRRESRIRLESDHPFFVRRLSIEGKDPLPTLDPPKPPSRHEKRYTATVSATGKRKVKLLVGLNDKVGSRENLLERYRREVEFTDQQLGDILDRLREEDWYEESWVIFTADHGEGLGCHGHLGHVQNLYDCLMHVPLILKPPRGTRGWEPGTRRTDLASLVDVLPTLLHELMLPVPSGLAGRNLAETASEPVVFLETHAPQARRTKYALRSSQWKIIWTPEDDAWELYDLQQDPLESINQADEEPDVLAQWKDRLHARVAGLKAAGADGQRLPIDPKTEEMLRSLGYVQ